MLEKERDALEKRRLEDLKNCKLELDKKWTQELERQEKVVAIVGGILQPSQHTLYSLSGNPSGKNAKTE